MQHQLARGRPDRGQPDEFPDQRDDERDQDEGSTDRCRGVAARRPDERIGDRQRRDRGGSDEPAHQDDGRRNEPVDGTGDEPAGDQREVDRDAILASACLPTIFKAVEIEDPETGRREAYWDGGYSGNPALFPLFRKDLPKDVLIININPLERAEIPQTPQAIQNRINEIGFNTSLLRELLRFGSQAV